MHTELETLKNELETMKAGMLQTQHRLQQTEAQQKHITRRARLLSGFSFALVIGTLSLSTLKPVGAQSGSGPTLSGLQQEINGLQAQINKLIQKTWFMSANGDTKTTTFSGCNVVIQSGSGSTDDGVSHGSTLTGLGNLIIGYDAAGNIYGDLRTGSHNLILGDRNSYSSYGGLIAGYYNTISAPYASVSGGLLNEAKGIYASVSGGYDSAAIGVCS